MDDGQHVKRGGVTLCTDSFQHEEVETLREALNFNFKLNQLYIYNKIYINIKRFKFSQIYKVI